MVVAFSWSDKHGDRHRWAQALRIREGRIVDIQDHRSPTQATVIARVHAVFG